MAPSSAVAALKSVDPVKVGTPVDEAARIRSAGRIIVLADGDEILVRFGFRAMAEVEKRMGSIAALADACFHAYAGASAKAVLEVLSIFTGLSHAEVEKRLDVHQLPDYLGAIEQALIEALPEPQGGEAPKGSEANASPGTSSTTSEPSPSDAATPTSG